MGRRLLRRSRLAAVPMVGRVAMFLLCTSLTSPAAVPDQQVAPDHGVIRSYLQKARLPLWVSAAAATKGDGSPDYSLLDKSVRWLLATPQERAEEWERQRARAEAEGRFWPPRSTGKYAPKYDWAPDFPADCKSSFGHVFRDPGTPSHGSLAGLVDDALGIYRGTIVAVEGGFLFGQGPWSLLVVRVDEAVRSSRDFDTRESLLIVHPHARFTFAGQKLCSDDPYFRYPPKVGAEVLLFALLRPPDVDQRLILAEQPETVFFYDPETAALFIPDPIGKNLKGAIARDLAGARTLDDVVARVRLLAEGPPGR